MQRQPWCMGSGRQVGVAHSIGGRTATCTWCSRSELQINRDGTLRYHVAVPVDDEPRSSTRTRQPLPVFR